MKNFDDYTFRCSGLGHLMTKGRSKTDVLSKTAQSHLDQIFKSEYFKRYKEFDSKYTNKGKDVEMGAIVMLSNIEDVFYTKNEERFYNDWIQGEPDVIMKDEIIDIKCPWDYTTFPLTETECPTPLYYWQLQGYMWLLNKKKARLAYCLMDTPMCMKHTTEVEEISYMDKRRIKTFSIEYNQEDVERLKINIGHARDYLNQLQKQNQ